MAKPTRNQAEPACGLPRHRPGRMLGISRRLPFILLIAQIAVALSILRDFSSVTSRRLYISHRVDKLDERPGAADRARRPELRDRRIRSAAGKHLVDVPAEGFERRSTSRRAKWRRVDRPCPLLDVTTTSN